MKAALSKIDQALFNQTRNRVATANVE